MGATVVDREGNRVPVHMGSHGIGVSRLVGAIIEASHDDRGIIWPEGVTPFHCGIVNLKSGDAEADAACEAIHAALEAVGLEPLYDDTDERAGAKFATMDLIGLPWRITVGPRGLKNGVVELPSRRSGESEELPPEAAVARVAQIYGKALAD
jgi:prolyl-tRNA synthetase